MSWNAATSPPRNALRQSTSSWGRELKYYNSRDDKTKIKVDLFVRSWVEIYIVFTSIIISIVDLFVRSWVEIPSHNITAISIHVDLFVRSWVEICISVIECLGLDCRPLREVVSWNLNKYMFDEIGQGRPLREVVSWNEIIGGVLTNHSMVDLFVRSWVEMYAASRQPSNFLVDLFVRSWVEIGLYYIVALQRRVDLFVRSWVEMMIHYQ